SFREATRAGSGYFAVGPRRRFATIEERYEFLVENWAGSSILMNRICGAYGMRYLHFLQPNQYVAGTKPMLDAERKIAVNTDQPYRTGVARGYPLLIQRGDNLRRQGVDYHDLTRIFVDHPEPIYADDCCHFNQAGYEIVAEHVANAMCSDSPSTRH